MQELLVACPAAGGAGTTRCCTTFARRGIDWDLVPWLRAARASGDGVFAALAGPALRAPAPSVSRRTHGMTPAQVARRLAAGARRLDRHPHLDRRHPALVAAGRLRPPSDAPGAHSSCDARRSPPHPAWCRCDALVDQVFDSRRRGSSSASAGSRAPTQRSYARVMLAPSGSAGRHRRQGLPVHQREPQRRHRGQQDAPRIPGGQLRPGQAPAAPDTASSAWTWWSGMRAAGWPARCWTAPCRRSRRAACRRARAGRPRRRRRCRP